MVCPIVLDGKETNVELHEWPRKMSKILITRRPTPWQVSEKPRPDPLHHLKGPWIGFLSLGTGGKRNKF